MNKKIIALTTLLSMIAVPAFTLASCEKKNSETTPVVNKYKVTVTGPEDEEYTYALDKTEYKAGDLVTLSVTIQNELRTLLKVTSENDSVVFIVKNDIATFTMPEGDITVKLFFTDRYSSEIPGEGSETSPYIIENKVQLKEFATKYNKGDFGEVSSMYVELGADIDMSNMAMEPIGSYAKPFTGSFDGKGHTISNLKKDAFTTEKITNTVSISYLGLFGVTNGALIHNVKMANTVVDADIIGKDTYGFASGVVSYAVNTFFEDVHVDYSTFEVTTLQNGKAQVIMGGIAAELDGVGSNTSAYALYMNNSSVVGNIAFDFTNAADTIVGVTGGLIGLLDTTASGANIFSMLNSYYQGDIYGHSYVGGLIANISEYSSITNSYVVSDSIVADSPNVAYAGGLVGFGASESIVMESYADVKKVTAKESTGHFKSMAGSIVGYQPSDGYDDNENEMGMDVYNTYVAPGAIVTSNKINLGAEHEYSKEFLKNNLNFQDNIFDFTAEYPTIKDDYSYTLATVNLDPNFTGATSTSHEYDSGYFSKGLVSTISNDETVREHYSYLGFAYDKEGKHPYRWYTPLSHSMTLYNRWGDLSLLVGSYDTSYTYYEASASSGNWIFDENHFYWLRNDGGASKYEYHFDGTYIFIDEYVGTLNPNALGAYEGSIFKRNEDGSLTGVDVNDSNAVYKAVKSSTPVEAPDWTGNAIVGNWYINGETSLVLNADGNAVSTKVGTSGNPIDYFGGFKLSGNQFTFDCAPAGKGTYTYYETEQFMVKEDNSSYITREKVTSTYSTESGDVKILLTATKNFVIKNGALVASGYTGTLEEGKTVTIDGDKYTVSGTTLVGSTTPEEPSTTYPFAGTWKGKVGNNTVTLVLNNDGTGVYGDTAITFTVDGNTITGTCSDFTITLVYDASVPSLSVTWVDTYEEYRFTGVLNDFTPASSEPETPVAGYLGTWTGKMGSNTCTLILNADMTGSYNGNAFNYTVSGNVITASWASGYFKITCTYDENKGTMSVHFEDDDYNELTGTFTKAA